MEKSFEKISNDCLLGKLSKEYHENDSHPEYRIRNIKLKDSFPKLLSILESEDFSRQLEDSSSSTLARLLILYLELKSEGPWNTEEIKKEEYLEKLNIHFKNKLNINLYEILTCNIFNTQEIFNICINELRKKMIMDEFKRYPSLIEVYCLLLMNVKNYKVTINPVTVLPVALVLIEDYVPANKIKGLQSCTALLQCLTTEHFTTGNYYEVVYSCLKKNNVEKDKEIIQSLFQCYIEFLNILPSEIKKNKLDDIFSSIVDQLHTETNLYRKADYFVFITKIIEMHKIHCVKKKVFKNIICENIDICSMESVEKILLSHVLECLQTWIRHCWCIWRLSADQKMLSSLFKMLYLTKDETVKIKIQNLIITLIKLCTKEEQMDILENIEEPLANTHEDFLSRLEIIKNKVAA